MELTSQFKTDVDKNIQDTLKEKDKGENLLYQIPRCIIKLQYLRLCDIGSRENRPVE